VRALATWTKAAGITQGALFRHVTRHGEVKARLAGEAVAEIVKRAAKDAGLDHRRYAGHSLRAGLVTAAAKAGKPERVIAEQTGHKSIAQLRKYVREGGLFEENAAGGLL
jgi:integrase